MRIWATLGIEQTYDIPTIRRAYAKKLRIHHPEDDPQGYQQLREAYDLAMKLAKQYQQSQAHHSFTEEEEEEETSSSPFPDPRQDEDGDSDSEDRWNPYQEAELETEQEESTEQDMPRIPRLPKWSTFDAEEKLDQRSEENKEIPFNVESDGDYDDSAEDVEDDEYDLGHDGEADDPFDIDEELDEDYDDPEHPVSIFMEQVKALYSNFPARMDTRSWLELLSSDTLWNIDYQRVLSAILLDYFEQHYFLPSEVWHLLEDSFRWRARSIEDTDFAEQYPKIYAYAVMEFPGLQMDYGALLQAQDTLVRYDDFLRYREAVALALLENDIRSAHVHLIKARSIFKEDKDLLRLQTEFYRRTSDWDNALDSCNEYIRLDPNSHDAVILRIRFLLRMNKADEALRDVHQVLAQIPRHAEALSLAGQCHLKLGQLEQAQNAFNQVLAIDREEIEAVLYLAQIQRCLEEQLQQLKGQERKNAKRKINEQLGRLPLRSRLQRAAMLLLSRRWHILAIIIVLHLIIGQSVAKHTGTTPWVFAKHLFLQPEAIAIHNATELEALPTGNHAVQLKLTNTKYLGILEISDEDDKASPYQYIHMDEAKKLGLMNQISGYVCIGYAGDASVIIIANYDQAMAAYQGETLEIAGDAQPALPQQLQREIDNWQQNLSGSSNYLDGYPLTDYYVIVKDGVSKSNPIAELPANSLYLTLLLILFYIPFLQELRRQWRYIRYN